MCIKTLLLKDEVYYSRNLPGKQWTDARLCQGDFPDGYENLPVYVLCLRCGNGPGHGTRKTEEALEKLELVARELKGEMERAQPLWGRDAPPDPSY